MKIETIASILFSLTNIPIQVMDEKEKSVLYNSLNMPAKVRDYVQKNKTQISTHISNQKSVRLKDLSNMIYVGFLVGRYKIILGPFLDQDMDVTILSAFKRRLRLIGEEAILLDNMVNQLRVLNSSEIDFLYHLVLSVVNQPITPITYHKLVPEKVKSVKEIDVDQLFKEFKFVEQNYQNEDLYLHIVETGDIEKAHQFETSEIMVKLPERAINDSLRNSKTRLTIFNTLCNRAAIRGGIDVQLGHQISTNFGIIIESMKSNFDTNIIIRDILVSYTEAVNNYAIKNYSNLIRNAILYIRRHITTNVSLQEIADFLFVSKEHLSRQFKQEAGQTITQYINHSKIIEAKKLLEQKSQTVMDIAIMLGFANSSHFSKVFKEQVGVTPKQYQKNKEN